MTREEIHRDYQIPLSVIKAYDEWALSGSKTPQYSEEDLRRLSLLVTLHEAGFSAQRPRRICGWMARRAILEGSAFYC